jgi:hypothetical protein
VWTRDLGVIAMVCGAIVVFGTLTGGPLLRLFRWADLKTSAVDALNAQLLAAPLLAIFIHYALQRPSPALRVFSHNDVAGVAGMSFVYCIAFAVALLLLRRHRAARSFGTGFGAGVFVLFAAFALIAFLKGTTSFL